MDWISVKERLPEDFENVIICYKRRDGEWVVEESWHFIRDSAWRGTRDWLEDELVPYWMPLPEPPKEE